MTTPVIRQTVSFSPMFWQREQERSARSDEAFRVRQPRNGRRAARSARTRVDDREFLPAAIEIYETPPSPVAVSLIWLICALFAAALVWSYFGWMDITAVAAGKIQPSGHSKVVQPLEPGRIESILVENGARVQAGDVLLELDPTETAADQNAQRLELESAAAEAARRKAAIAAAKSDASASPIEFPQGIRSRIREREQAALVAELVQLAASLNSLNAQAEQTRAAVGRLTDSIAAREKVVALAKERVDMREQVDRRGAGSRSQVIDALERYQTEVTAQVAEQGQLRESSAALQATEKKIAEIVSQFIAEQTEKLVEAERKHDRLSQDLIKAEFKNARTRLKAPVSGTVQQLAVTTVGQVVTSGQALLTIVPPDAPLEIEALILNKDIGFVRAGQPVIIKVDAFPFTRYGVIKGTVTRVSADAVDMRNAPNLSEAQAAVRPQGPPSALSGSGPELAFPATIALTQRSMDLDGTQVNLSPGMTVAVEIHTGWRRIIDYILSPLREIGSQAAHER